MRENIDEAREFELVVNDGTMLKAFKRLLEKNRLLLESITECTPMGYLVVDNDSDEILYSNSEFFKIWKIQYLEEKVRSGELKNNDIIPNCIESIANIQAFIDSCEPLQDMENRAIIEDEIEFKDGKIIRRFSGQVRDREDKYIGRLYIFEDITDKKNNDLELKIHKEKLEQLVDERTKELNSVNNLLQSEVQEKENVLSKLEMYRILSENISDIILFIDEHGYIIEANQAAINTYGYKIDEINKLHIDDLRDHKYKGLNCEHMLQGDKSVDCYEAIHTRKDGTSLWAQVSVQSALIQNKIVLMAVIRDITERKEMEKKLEYIAKHDLLTGIPNRYCLEEYLNSSLKNGIRNDDVVLAIDIDNFKLVNDSFGYTVGDKIIIQIAEYLKKAKKENWFISRIGGDEFVVVMHNTGLSNVKIIANKIMNDLQGLEFYVPEVNKAIKITVSIGVTSVDEFDEFNKLLSFVNEALLRAKDDGKNRFVVLDKIEDKDKVLNKNKMLNLVQEAFKNNKFFLCFQPIFHKGNEILHYEALVRMFDENNNIIPPSNFLPVAEKYELMGGIDKWVIYNVLKLLTVTKHLNIFVNLSGVSLANEELLKWIETEIHNSGINPCQIGFEITETTAIKDLDKTRIWVTKLKSLGCQFALDDFGVGFSSFSHLQELPVDYLKIDGSFVRNLHTDSTKIALVNAMNTLAHTLGKKTIAEFVENDDIWRILHDLDVDCGQGYYLGKPSTIEYIIM